MKEGRARQVRVEEFPQDGARERAGVGIVRKRGDGGGLSNRSGVVGEGLHCSKRNWKRSVQVSEIC